MNLEPRVVMSILSMGSFFRLRSDCFHLWLASAVCQTSIPCQKARTSCFSQHTLMEGSCSHGPCPLLLAGQQLRLHDLLTFSFDLDRVLNRFSHGLQISPICPMCFPRIIQITSEIMFSQLDWQPPSFLTEYPA